MKEIQLNKDMIAKIDDEDFEKVSKHTWRCTAHKKTFYAYSYFGGKKSYLHRFVMGATERNIVDHKDRDGLNCQKENLRFCTNGQNMQNGSLRKDNKLRFKGVHSRSDNKTNGFRAEIMACGIKYHLGYFSTAEEAARAYDAKAKELFGEFASPNF